MKLILSLILSLVLLCAVLSAASADTGLVTVRSDKEAFSTMAPAGKPVTFDADDGSLYIWLDEEGYIPNLWVCRLEDKLNDPVRYVHELYEAYMKEQYGDRLVAVSKLSDYEIGGKSLPAAVFTYKTTSGYLVNQINLVEARDDGDVVFQARYPNGDDEETLNALDAAIRYYQPDGVRTSAPQGGTVQQGGTSSGAAQSFTVTNVKQDNMIVGRCVAPAGFTVTSQAACCTERQCLDHPWLLYIGAASQDGITMEYLSAQGYYSDSSTPDGSYVTQYLTPALHYMTAAEYCDYWASLLYPGAKITLVEENTHPEMQSILRQKEQAYLNQINSMAGGLGLTAEKDSRTVCTRCYYINNSGSNVYYIISTSTHGIWMKATSVGPFVTISSSYTLWEAPYVYSMSCPEALWESNRSIFTVFMENTSVNDQFLLANQRLSSELQSMMTGVSLIGGESYSRRVMQETTSSGNDYNDERFTDYIFDQNDYTLSDGSHIKVSSAYDYVYEGDNGVVYYSDSAFSQPGGSTQLTPNR